MNTSFKHLLAGTCLTLALGAFTVSDASAIDVGVGTSTGVNTGVSTSQNTGVELGTGARVNGGIRTGTNTSGTSVDTDVDSSTSADVRGGRRDRDRDGAYVRSDTDVNSGVSTSQSSGVYVPEGARINGGIRSGANVSGTGISTDVDSNTRASLSAASTRGEEMRRDGENRHRGWWQGNNSVRTRADANLNARAGLNGND